MKQVGVSVLAMILCLIGFRIISPAAEAAPEPTYHIAYLLQKGIRFENEYVRPENLLRGLAAHKVEIAYSWKDLLAIHAKQPLDALIIHASAVQMVDFEWLADVYWQGLTISTISIYPPMIAHLFDDACLPYGRMPVPEEMPYVTISTNLIMSLHDQTQVSKWYRRDWRRNCGHRTPAEVSKPTETSMRYTSGPLINAEIHEMYQVLFLDHIQYAHDERKRFIEANKELAVLQAQ